MNIDQVLQIARHYYEQNKTQEEIAQQMLVSRSTVSRALKMARERGYIRTIVVAPSSNAPRSISPGGWNSRLTARTTPGSAQ